MQLSDILTVEQVGAMREISSKPTFAQIHVPFLSDEARGFISAFVGRKSDENFWKRLRSEYDYAPSVMVCVVGKSVEVIQVRQSVIFAKHLGDMLKRGAKICWVRNRVTFEVNWENWKSVYKSLTAVQSESDALPMPPSRHQMRMMREERGREKAFYEAASVIRNKKLNKRGYNMSFDEIRAQMRHDAYEKHLRGVEIEARKIYMTVL